MCPNDIIEKVYVVGFPFRAVGNERVGGLNPQDQNSSCSFLPFLCFCEESSNDHRHKSRESDQMGGIEISNARISDTSS
jgi:hypothetical protein